MPDPTALDHPAPVHPQAAEERAPAPEPAPSKAAIAGHPIHPMLIPFPVALLTLVAITDVVYAVTESVFWSSASYYLLWGGLVSAGLAAVFGLIDFIGIKRAHTARAGWAHLLLNIAIVALASVNLLLRWDEAVDFIVPSGLILSIVGAGLLLVSGWFGGELSYRHKIGVMGPRAPKQGGLEHF